MTVREIRIWCMILAMVSLLVLLWGFRVNAEGDEPSIAEMATEWVGEKEATVVEAVCFEIGEEYDIDPWLIACVWRYEAGFDKTPSGYYIGGLQLDPLHLKHFEEYGLDTTSWKDWIRYGVQLWRLSADNDKSLYEALKPWGVRKKAMSLYRKIRGSYERWDSFIDDTTVDCGVIE